MNRFEISIPEGETQVIRLNELSKPELQQLLDIALEYENYEMCAHLKKYMDLLK
jgi:hypothetical protein